MFSAASSSPPRVASLARAVPLSPDAAARLGAEAAIVAAPPAFASGGSPITRTRPSVAWAGPSFVDAQGRRRFRQATLRGRALAVGAAVRVEDASGGARLARLLQLWETREGEAWARVQWLLAHAETACPCGGAEHCEESELFLSSEAADAPLASLLADVSVAWHAQQPLQRGELFCRSRYSATLHFFAPLPAPRRAPPPPPPPPPPLLLPLPCPPPPPLLATGGCEAECAPARAHITAPPHAAAAAAAASAPAAVLESARERQYASGVSVSTRPFACHCCERVSQPALRGWASDPACDHFWCAACLARHFALSFAEVLASGRGWECPVCEGACGCPRCRAAVAVRAHMSDADARRAALIVELLLTHPEIGGGGGGGGASSLAGALEALRERLRAPAREGAAHFSTFTEFADALRAAAAAAAAASEATAAAAVLAALDAFAPSGGARSPLLQRPPPPLRARRGAELTRQPQSPVAALSLPPPPPPSPLSPPPPPPPSADSHASPPPPTRRPSQRALAGVRARSRARSASGRARKRPRRRESDRWPPERCARFALLVDIHGRDWVAIAAELGVSERAVRAHAQHVLAALQERGAPLPSRMAETGCAYRIGGGGEALQQLERRPALLEALRELGRVGEEDAAAARAAAMRVQRLAGITQVTLAARAALAQSTLSHFVNGRLSPARADKIASALARWARDAVAAMA